MSTNDITSSPAISDNGFALVITTTVFGVLAAVAGIIYACIYCHSIRPRKGHAIEGEYGAVMGRLEGSGGEGDKSAIKMHPLFALSKLGRLRDGSTGLTTNNYNN